MRILGVTPSENIGACEWYRIVEPLEAMRKLGFDAWVDSAPAMLKRVEAGKNPMPYADMVIFQRLIDTKDNKNLWVDIAKSLREDAHVAVVVDYDDDYSNQYRVVSSGSVPNLSAFSAVTVSTPYLKKVMQSYNRVVRVLPNAIMPEHINNGFKRILPELTIGLTGSSTHKGDWPAVYGPIKRILEKHPGVRLFCSGFIPEELKGHPQLVTLREMGAETDQDDFFIPLGQYPYILRNIDILLCPVDPSDKFNWSKSNLKAIEGMASERPVDGGAGGCAVIATGDLPIYRDAVLDGKTGLLVNHLDEEGWFGAIDKLVSDASLRARLQIAGHEFCMKNWSIQNRVRERVATFTEILDGERRGRSKPVRGSVAALPNRLAVAGRESVVAASV